LWQLAVLFCALLLARLLYVKLNSPEYTRILAFNAGFLIFATGFAAMATEIILLYLFQNIYGYIYQKIGLIVALFMVGLALGSFVMTRLLPKLTSHLLRTVILFEALIIAYFGALIFAIGWLTGASADTGAGWHLVEFSFYAFVTISGFLGGAEFPLAGQIFLLCRKRVGISASLVDSTDHLGAALGAFFAGVLILPILGIIQSFVVLLMLKAVGLVLILSSGWRKVQDTTLR
jgi:spermidine synthase